jgi:FMN phosphatase YigB (HAD superfamily)
MKSAFYNLLARMNKEPTVYVFDLDDTLFKANSCVCIRDYRTHVLLRKLTQTQFENALIDDKNEIIDYTEFESISLNARPLPLINKLKKAISSGNCVYILTARSNKVRPSLFRLLKRHKINIPDESVFTVGDPADNSTSAQQKHRILSRLRFKHTGEIMFIDDDQKNIDAANMINIDGKTITAVNCNAVK